MPSDEWDAQCELIMHANSKMNLREFWEMLQYFGAKLLVMAHALLAGHTPRDWPLGTHAGGNQCGDAFGRMFVKDNLEQVS